MHKRRPAALGSLFSHRSFIIESSTRQVPSHWSVDARRGSSRLVQIVNPVIERDRQRSPPPRHLSPGDRGTIARDRRPAAAAGLRAVQCTVKRRSSDREAVGHACSGRRQRSVSVARVLPEKTMKIYYQAERGDVVRRMTI